MAVLPLENQIGLIVLLVAGQVSFGKLFRRKLLPVNKKTACAEHWGRFYVKDLLSGSDMC